MCYTGDAQSGAKSDKLCDRAHIFEVDSLAKKSLALHKQKKIRFGQKPCLK